MNLKNIPIFVISILLITLGCKNSTPSDIESSNSDIPKPVSTKVSLAGSSEPDIVRFLKVQRAISPSLSPNEEWVAYRTSITGEPQVWVTKTDKKSAPMQVTYGNSVTFHKWIPDNSGILYSTDKDGNEKEGYYIVSRDGTKEKELLPPSDAFRFFGDFNSDGTKFAYSTTERNGTDFDIHIYDLQSNADQKIYKGKLGYYPISFSPDGQYIVISEAIGEDANNLFLLNVDDSSLTQINNPDDLSFYGNIEWRLDSQSFFLRTNAGKEFIGVSEYIIDSESFKNIYQDDYDIDQIILDSNSLHLVLNKDGYSEHSIFDLSNGNNSKVSVWPAGIISLVASEQKNTILAFIRSPKIPGDLWKWIPGSSEAVRISQSSNGGIDLDGMVIPEAHSFTARDGLKIFGLLYSPKSMDENTPLVIMVHGGPTAQARPGFSPMTQYLVKKGYSIFDLNYRGSTGYGKSYARENNLRKREKELYDLEDAVKYLVDKEVTNGKRAAIIGGSYGGYLTMAALTRMPDVFSCGVAFVGVSNWISALEGASPALKAQDRLEYGDIDDPVDREFFETISPINYIDQIKSPVMVLHGANDPRDPVTESDLFVSGIRNNGGEVEYLRFPDEGHGIRKMDNRITAYVRVAEFLEKNM